MKSFKEQALRVISSLPDDAPVDEVMYRLYTIDKVRRGLQDIKEGKTVTTEALSKEIDSW